MGRRKNFWEGLCILHLHKKGHYGHKMGRKSCVRMIIEYYVLSATDNALVLSSEIHDRLMAKRNENRGGDCDNGERPATAGSPRRQDPLGGWLERTREREESASSSQASPAMASPEGSSPCSSKLEAKGKLTVLVIVVGCFSRSYVGGRTTGENALSKCTPKGNREERT